MPTKAYKLRAELADSFVGGSVIDGVNCGTIDLKAALDEGGGVIITDSVHLQTLMESYYGILNDWPTLVFDAHLVDPETGEQTKIEPPVQAPIATAPRPDLIGAPAPVGDPNDPSSPIHGDSGYSGLTPEELQDIATERGLKIPKGATDDDIISILETNDEEN